MKRLGHICPACGKKYSCECSPDLIEHAEHMHVEPFPCSLECAQHLEALETYLRQRGMG